jgi:excisionase family DNA binding protein
MTSDDILTVPEAAKRLKVGLNVMYTLTHRTDFPCFKIGKQIRIKVLDLDKWIEDQRGNH